ncbi:uncharacterized protein LOC143922761 [Arctopsyche grandis]|uniref:uncharacterized protein LOC143922761 n=1 Tax=Arctopsyche grandis TaxID=121162 RepID=UPI00406D6934
MLTGLLLCVDACCCGSTGLVLCVDACCCGSTGVVWVVPPFIVFLECLVEVFIDAYERNFVFVEASNFLECLMEVVIDAYERNFVFVEASNFLECLAPFRSMYFNGGGVFRPFWFHSTGRGVPPEFNIMTAGACRLGFGNVVCCCGIFSKVSMTMTTTRFLHGSPVSVNDVCDFVGILMCWSLLTRWRRCLSGCAGESCLDSGSCVACRSKSCSLPGCLFWASCVGSEGLRWLGWCCCAGCCVLRGVIRVTVLLVVLELVVSAAGLA